MLLKNYDYLQKNILNLHNILRKNPYKPEEAVFQYDEINSIVYNVNDELINIFSKVNPLQEAKFILEQYEDLEEKDEVILLGIGNGSIIKALDNTVRKSCKVFVIDFMEVFQLLINNYDIKDIDLERVSTFTLISQNMDFESFFKAFIGRTNGNFELVILPQYQRLFNEKINEFIKKLSEYVKSKRNSTLTNRAYEKRWITNSLKNSNKVLDTANFLDLMEHDFSCSAAFIVSAGPSLDFDIEYLKKISEDNNTYIFGVGSANKTLMKHGIEPDGIFTYDPSPLNQHVIREYSEHEMEAPIIFGSSVGHETLEPFSEKFKYHILISQDKLSSILLKENYLKKGILDSPTIAIITLQALIKLGFKKIIFAGQNLGFYKKKRYSDAVSYSFSQKEITEKELENKVIVDDVYGNEMVTNQSFNTMRIIFEKYISNCESIDFINTTKYGAHIKGTSFQEISDVYPLLKDFKKPIDLKEYNEPNHYDLKKVKQRYNKLDQNRLACKELLITLDKEMKYIKDQLKANDYQSLEGYDKKIEELLNELFKNTYFSLLLKLMNRSYYNILINNFSKIKNEKIHEKKYRMIYQKIGPLIVSVMQDYNKTINDFIAIKKDIDKRCNE